MRKAALFLVLGLTATTVAAAPRTKKAPEPPPLVRMPSPPPDAFEMPLPDVEVVATYMDWEVGDTKLFAVAYTLNESDSEFGLICRDSCIFYLDVSLECQKGEIYPAMMNSSAGSGTFHLRCYRFDGNPALTASPSTELINAFHAGGEIGFAVPLQSGRFNISRFSLTGGVEALRRLREVATAKHGGDQDGLRDFTI